MVRVLFLMSFSPFTETFTRYGKTAPTDSLLTATTTNITTNRSFLFWRRRRLARCFIYTYMHTIIFVISFWVPPFFFSLLSPCAFVVFFWPWIGGFCGHPTYWWQVYLNIYNRHINIYLYAQGRRRKRDAVNTHTHETTQNCQHKSRPNWVARRLRPPFAITRVRAGWTGPHTTFDNGSVGSPASNSRHEYARSQAQTAQPREKKDDISKAQCLCTARS